MKKRIRLLSLALLSLFAIFALYFPGKQLPIAFTLATGIGRHSLQSRIDHCEAKAIAKQEFTEDDLAFLSDLYTCLYKGARLTLVLPEVSKMMRHYLSKSGQPLRVKPSIFNTNTAVIKVMKEMVHEMDSSPAPLFSYRSETFYMPDSSNIDSVFGLYYGYLVATPKVRDHEISVTWTANVPWEWPSYEHLAEKYGDPHAESFPIPNASCLINGIGSAVFIDNGLGEYLTRLGLAKEFIVYSEWVTQLKKG